MVNRFRWFAGCLPVWLVGIGLILYGQYRTGTLDKQLMTGIQASNIRGNINYLLISQWLCTKLPLYFSMGFYLFQNKEGRNYHLIRYVSYEKWWKKLCMIVVWQTAVYYIIWGIVGKVSCQCLLLMAMNMIMMGLLTVGSWELFHQARSTLCVVVNEFLSICFSYILPYNIQKRLLSLCGMYRYVQNMEEYLVCITVLLVITIILYTVFPRLYRKIS